MMSALLLRMSIPLAALLLLWAPAARADEPYEGLLATGGSIRFDRRTTDALTSLLPEDARLRAELISMLLEARSDKAANLAARHLQVGHGNTRDLAVSILVDLDAHGALNAANKQELRTLFRALHRISLANPKYLGDPAAYWDNFSMDTPAVPPNPAPAKEYDGGFAGGPPLPGPAAPDWARRLGEQQIEDIQSLTNYARQLSGTLAQSVGSMQFIDFLADRDAFGAGFYERAQRIIGHASYSGSGTRGASSEADAKIWFKLIWETLAAPTYWGIEGDKYNLFQFLRQLGDFLDAQGIQLRGPVPRLAPFLASYYGKEMIAKERGRYYWPLLNSIGTWQNLEKNALPQVAPAPLEPSRPASPAPTPVPAPAPAAPAAFRIPARDELRAHSDAIAARALGEIHPDDLAGIHETLSKRFGRWSDLEMFLRYELNAHLDSIADRGAMSAVYQDVTQHFIQAPGGVGLAHLLLRVLENRFNASSNQVNTNPIFFDFLRVMQALGVEDLGPYRDLLLRFIHSGGKILNGPHGRGFDVTAATRQALECGEVFRGR